MHQAVRTEIISTVRAGDLPRAVLAAQSVLDGGGGYDGYKLLVDALLDAGKPDIAAGFFGVLRQALPGDAEIAFGSGLALQRSGKLDAAIGEWRAALGINPNFVDACRNLAMGLLDLGRDADALPVLARLAALAPRDPTVPLHRGNIAQRAGNFAEAVAQYRAAIALDGNDAVAWTNLGEAERFAGHPGEAEASLRRAIELAPGSQQAHFNLAGLLLDRERWREGFAEFQWRKNLDRIPPALAALPEWTRAAGPGARVALWNDQGLGDALFFLRYARSLHRRTARVTAILQPPLVRLAAGVSGIDEVLTLDQKLPTFTHQIAIASLPHLFGGRTPKEDWTGPYLGAAVSGQREIRRVGLAWAAGFDSPNGRARSVPLSTLAPLAEIPRLEWHSLQLGPAVAEVEAGPWRGILRDHSAELTDFAATAAVAAGLDLVISVDTSVAHLAGGLGLPTWVVLSRPCDWRWHSEGESSAWYPGARLFRQPEPGDWDSVVSAVMAALG